MSIGVAEADFQAVAHAVAGALGHRPAFATRLRFVRRSRCSTRARCITLMCIRLRPRRDAALPSCELLMCSAECSGGTARRCTRSACMQANTANEHSQMLAQVPANACSDSESRKCSLVLLLVSYSTLARKVFRLRNTARARAQTGSGSREHSINDDEQTRLFQ